MGIVTTLVRGAMWGFGLRLGRSLYDAMLGDPPKTEQSREALNARIDELERELETLRKKQRDE